MFRKITIEEMKLNIFRYKDFPVVMGISSRWLIKKDNFWGLFIDNNLIGITKFIIKYNICRIKLLEVKENYQNQGYGSQMLQEIEKIAKNNNCKEINLLPRDYRVYDFYKSNGYKLIHEHLMKKEI